MSTLQELFGVAEAYRLPDAIMHALLSENAEEIIRKTKQSISCDIRDMFQDEQGDRKNLKQDFTPDCICSLVSSLTIPGTFLDMCSGTGVLGKAVSQRHHIPVYAQEFSERTIPFALLDACMNGLEGYISRADCLRGEIFHTYRLERMGYISLPKEVENFETGKYDNVIMNPPYSMKFPDAEDFPVMGLQIPKSKADYGFVLRGIEHMKDGGRLTAILPHGVLFRGQAEGKIREHLIQNRMVSAVVGLPDKLFLHTSIPVCLLILERNSHNVLFINAEKEFEKGSKQNDMTREQIQKISDAFYRRTEQESFSHVASYSEIEENGYNLNIPRYVNTYVQEPLPDAKEILSSLKQIDAEEKAVMGELYRMLGELTGEGEDMEVIKKHREILKPKRTVKKEEKRGQMELMELYADAMQTGEH